MAEKNNVVIQDFGEETFEFLAGYKDKDGNVIKEFAIREITGVEEEAISKAGIRENGGKVVRTILEKCITRIGDITPKIGQREWRDIIQSLSIADQDYALLKIREATLGSEIEMEHKCPHCGASLKSIIDIDELNIIPFGGEEILDFELPKGYRDKQGTVHKLGKIRYPNGFDREVLDTIARKNIGTANTMLLTRCIVELGDVKVHDAIIRGLSIKDREYLLNVLRENAYGVELETDITCSSCGEEFRSTLNMVNFL